MDDKAMEIRYGKWIQAIHGWSSSGLSKKEYCQANGIDEKRFYYYQRRIRSIIAAQGLVATNENYSETSLATPSGNEKNKPQIVRLKIPATAQEIKAVISFNVNGIDLAVPEDVSTSFLSKLLEAASHASC
jgi:hypothetical protein